MPKTVDEYLKLPYTRELIPEPEGGWFVRIKELPGCISQGETPQRALEMIEDAMRGWLAASLDSGDPIPEPRGEADYSGKFLVRVPRQLHRRLAQTAEEQGVSLNQYVNVILAGAVAQPALPVILALHSQPRPAALPALHEPTENYTAPSQDKTK